MITGIMIVSAQDTTPPDRPYISYVSVDTANNNVEIHWTESPSSDVKQYNIYYEILTVNGYEGLLLSSVSPTITSYTHLSNEAGQKPLLYSVTALDFSGNESLRTPGLHSTVHSNVFYDSCNNANVVYWNKYVGWDNNVSGYRILGREGNGGFSILQGVNATDTSYVFYNIKQNSHYYYFVEAINFNSLESSSNIAHKYTYMPDPPPDMIIDYATIRDGNIVDIKFEFSDTSAVDDFVLLRSSKINSDFNIVRQIIDVPSSPVIINDTILAQYQSFFYRVGAINTCLLIIDTSNLATNILLSCENQERTNVLSWNSYQNFTNGVASYEIYRLDKEGNETLIGTNPPSQIQFIDNLFSIFGENYQGKISYVIHATENSSGNFSASNIYEIELITDILIPNAFTPNADGKNDIFKPIINFNPRDYLLVIYNRYGIAIYKSGDPEEGWDGTVNGNKPAPEGVYTYHIQFTSFTGQKRIIKPGTVTLFYP